MEDSTCPHCGDSTVKDAPYCRHCGRRIADFKPCPTCQEPISQIATVCPYCTRKVPVGERPDPTALTGEIRATRLGGLLTSGRPTYFFHPPVIRVSEGRIRVTTWTFLGLRVSHQEIQVTRVASVRYTKGIIWGGLLIETFGGASEDMAQLGLPQEPAREMAEKLKAILAEEM